MPRIWPIDARREARGAALEGTKAAQGAGRPGPVSAAALLACRPQWPPGNGELPRRETSGRPRMDVVKGCVRSGRQSAGRHALACLVLWGLLAMSSRLALAEPRWPDEQQAGPFWCHADFSLATCRPLLDELGELKSDLAAALGMPAPRQTIHVFLFQTRATYQAYLQQYFPQVPQRRAMYIQVRGPGMVFTYRGPELDVDLRHEATHALLHAWLPQVPLWLDEGLAEYFEVPRDQRRAEHPHREAILRRMAVGGPQRLERLEGYTRVEQMGRDEYCDAWAWVHFLLHGPPEAQQELLRYLQELASASPPGPLSPRLRRRWPDLERRLEEHFGAGPPRRLDRP